jgi:hypothetical protein
VAIALLDPAPTRQLAVVTSTNFVAGLADEVEVEDTLLELGLFAIAMATNTTKPTKKVQPQLFQDRSDDRLSATGSEEIPVLS